MSRPVLSRGPAGEPRWVDVAIIGAGFAGLGMGIRLKRRGRESFVILERAHDVGGTWRDNTYPGVACDVPAHLYSFSFKPKPDWTQRFADGPEIQDYLRQCADDEGLHDNLEFGADLENAAWNDDAGHWVLRSASGEWHAQTLVMAAGRLSEPRIPEMPGLDDFVGPVFHSSRWDHSVALAGLRVGVVGAGASAVQIVPRIAGVARQLTTFQRTPAYVVPRADRTFSEQERRLFTEDPAAVAALRHQLFFEADLGLAQRQQIRPDIDLLRNRALGHLAEQVPDPELRRRLTPKYEIGCKRVLLSDTYYPALTRDDVTLESSELVRLDGNTAVSASGGRYRLDALVLATGFLTTEPPFARRVFGRAGQRLAEKWARGMVAFASTTVHGFPNMFVLDGPNASLSHNSAVDMIETQIDYVLGALDHLARSGSDAPGHKRTGASLEVDEAAERAYTEDIDAMSQSGVWLQGGCRSWYVDERSGRLTLLWPGSARSFRERNGIFDSRPYEGNSSG